MSKAPLSAGDRITSKCTKCKNITNHIIVAMVGDKIAKVECNTCGGVHNYRSGAIKKPAGNKKVGSSRPAKISKVKTDWEELLKDLDLTTATPYHMQMTVEPGDLIQHSSFGLGRVISVTKPNKMEVSFSSGVKLLRGIIAK